MTEPVAPITAAREKTLEVQDDLRRAEADLHEANLALADTKVGSVVTAASVQSSLAQSVAVEDQLHDAVQELKMVTELLRLSEQAHSGPSAEGLAPAGEQAARQPARPGSPSKEMPRSPGTQPSANPDEIVAFVNPGGGVDDWRPLTRGAMLKASAAAVRRLITRGQLFIKEPFQTQEGAGFVGTREDHPSQFQAL